ncbi:NADH-quinone oxidoreductase subunit NuoG [Buchnera aphidicola]|uniref:NADH-quinone oxidoreductase subunit NuoG n=1 Tax=Buchnera aphidicola TaxID=9 RepID=UPI0030EC6750
MTKIFINDKKYYVDSSKNLLQTCLNLGIELPYFCWHPALGSVGACRQCAVKKCFNHSEKSGILVMSCMTKIEKNLIITTHDEESINFRKNIIEFLMINHPHDCPVCEEGGNCHLQDMTVLSQHFKRRFIFKKKTYKNQNLGRFLSHEMNRCISCYRCVRYYKDYSDGKDFNVYGSNQNLYFGRLKSGDLESEYSGNLIEICPTGVFTDKTNSLNYVRKWDMQYSPSICSHCSLGCNIIVGERNGYIRKVENRYHGEINHYFLCDLGRFSYGHSNNKSRPSKCLIYKKKKFLEINSKKILKKVNKYLKISHKIIGIGSSRSSIENNFALLKIVGKKNFCTGMTHKEHQCSILIAKILKKNFFKNPSLKEIESHDVILILGEDVTQTSSRMALSIRQAMKNVSNHKFIKSQEISAWNSFSTSLLNKNINTRLFITNTEKTKLDDIANISYYGSLQKQKKIGFNILNLLKNLYFKNKNIKTCHYSLEIFESLRKAKKPLIISGLQNLSKSLIKIAYNIAYFLKKLQINVSLTLLTPNVNTMGLSLLKGMSLESSMKKVKKFKSYSVIILENDLYRHSLKSKLDFFLKNSLKVIVIDHQFTKTMKKSNFILPSCNFFESSGTVINNEMRSQKFFQVYKPSFYKKKNYIKCGWIWLKKIFNKFKEKKIFWNYTHDVLKHCISKISDFKNSNFSSPNSKFRIFNQKVPRSPNRFSGRAVAHSDFSIHERQQPKDHDSMFSFSNEGSTIYEKYSTCIPFVSSPGWNSSNAWNKFQDEIFGNIYAGNPGVKLFRNAKIHLEERNFKNIYLKKKISKNSFIVSPIFNLFWSDEISQYSNVFKKKKIFLKSFINIKDAQRKNICKEGLEFKIKYKKNIFKIFIYFSKILKSGQISIPIGGKIPRCLIGKKIKIL